MSGKNIQFEKAFPGQHDGEEVLLLFRQHPLVMRKALIFGLLAILVVVAPLALPQIYDMGGLADILLKVVLAVTGGVFLVWFFRWVGWYYTVFIATNQRIIAIRQKGLFNRTVDEWQLQDIINLNYQIGGFQAVLFEFGDLTARTYIGDLEMKTIHKPAEVHNKLMAIVRKGGGASGSTQRPN